VVVTILASGSQSAGGDISTPALLAGSVTVLKAPSAGTFTLDMGTNKLILNKGYKLQDIKITSTFNSTTATSTEPAVSITHPTAGLASVDVECTGSSNNVICVEVTGTGSHTLKDVRVDVADDSGATNPIIIGIKNNDAAANLSIVGGRVRPISNTATDKPVTLIRSDGVLTVTGLTVDMTNAGHAKASTGIALNKAGSSVTGSTISVSSPSSLPVAKGIDVQHMTGKSTVEGNTFIGSGPNSIAVIGGSNLSSGVTGALLNNDFLGSFASPPVQ
jgi:hypothetical protein